MWNIRWLMIASDTNRNGLQIRYASYSAIEWLDPMKEAPSIEGAFLVSATPTSGRHRGWSTGTVGAVVVLPMDQRLFLRERGT